ncbi:MAG: alanine--tRNA ligase-related protein [Lachnospiraceae bacterium]
MTKKRYYEDAYQTACDAKVLVCKECMESSGQQFYEIILEETVFYPEGGGQPGDTGYLVVDGLNSVRVTDTSETQEGILHRTNLPITVGSSVHGIIDWDRRFQYSQQHSGEHIFSGIVHQLFGYDNVGFHMGQDYVTVDFNGSLSLEQIEKVESCANEAVFRDDEILITYPTQEELLNIPYRSKKTLEGSIRIVEIPGADICACCGTHVARTGEIGIIKVTEMENRREGCRLTILIGWQAFYDYKKKHSSAQAISNLLSVPTDKITEAVTKLLHETGALRYALTQAKEQRLIMLSDQFKEESQQAILFEEDMTPEEVRKLCDMLMQKVTLALVCAGDDRTGYTYVLGSKTEDVKTLSKKLNAACHGRGGGKDTMFQGRVMATKEEIREVLIHWH